MFAKFEKWPYEDSVYYSVVTLTTIGKGGDKKVFGSEFLVSVSFHLKSLLTKVLQILCFSNTGKNV